MRTIVFDQFEEWASPYLAEALSLSFAPDESVRADRPMEVPGHVRFIYGPLAHAAVPQSAEPCDRLTMLCHPVRLPADANPNPQATAIASLFGDSFSNDDELLSVCVRRLEGEYILVGIAELFEETQIAAALRWPWLSIKRPQDISAAPMGEQADRHVVDLQLYRIMRERLEAFFSPLISDDAYLGYKASRIAANRTRLYDFAIGEDSFLPPVPPEIRAELAALVVDAIVLERREVEAAARKEFVALLDQMAESVQGGTHAT